jgi:hypothetical protein
MSRTNRQWRELSNDDLAALFHSPMAASQIAAMFKVTRNQVAGRLHRIGAMRDPARKMPKAAPKPVVISAEEQAERKMDERDLDILHDLDEGHPVAGTATYWGVPRSWVRALAKNAGAAA